MNWILIPLGIASILLGLFSLFVDGNPFGALNILCGILCLMVIDE